MKTKLLLNAAVKYIAGLLLVAALIFGPAGTFDYWNGWLFTGLLFGPMLVLGVVLFVKAPELLAKRLNAKEKQSAQKGVVAVSALAFIGGFVAAGLDFRFGWTEFPIWLEIAAAVILAVSYGLYAEVMRENAYLSRTIEVQEGQKVVDTGLYGIVRHPMYAVTILLFLSIPVVLGSAVSLVIFLVYPLAIVSRIKNEEALLAEELAGYREYMEKVRWRILPFIW